MKEANARFVPAVVIDSAGERWEREWGYMGPVFFLEGGDGAPDGGCHWVDFTRRMSLQDLQREIEEEREFIDS